MLFYHSIQTTLKKETTLILSVVMKTYVINLICSPYLVKLLQYEMHVRRINGRKQMEAGGPWMWSWRCCRFTTLLGRIVQSRCVSSAAEIIRTSMALLPVWWSCLYKVVIVLTLLRPESYYNSWLVKKIISDFLWKKTALEL